MDFELYPIIALRSRSFNAIIAPREMFIQALNSHLNLQRFKVLYVCRNHSGIPSSLDWRFDAPEVRRAFTVFQAMAALEESSNTIVVIEHDPLLYEDASEMTEYISQAMREAALDVAALLYSPGADPHLEELIKNEDRVFYFDEGPQPEARNAAKAVPKAQKSQTALEAFS